MSDTPTIAQDKRRLSLAPWFIARESIGRFEVYSKGHDGSFSVATCVKEVDANLVSAAPELMAALVAEHHAHGHRRVCGACDEQSSEYGKPGCDAYKPLWLLAQQLREAAIAKARGVEV